MDSLRFGTPLIKHDAYIRARHAPATIVLSHAVSPPFDRVSTGHAVAWRVVRRTHPDAAECSPSKPDTGRVSAANRKGWDGRAANGFGDPNPHGDQHPNRHSHRYR